MAVVLLDLDEASLLQRPHRSPVRLVGRQPSDATRVVGGDDIGEVRRTMRVEVGKDVALRASESTAHAGSISVGGNRRSTSAIVVAMEAVVCVGWRGGEPYRERNWAVVEQHYQSMGLPVVARDSDPEQPFVLPRALNRAVDDALDGGADVVVVSDADVLISAEHLGQAIRVAHERQVLAHPLKRYWRLFRDGSPPPVPEFHQAGGIHVFGRDAWQFLGGYDERFEGWAPHDAAMLFAASTFCRVEQTDGDVVHLWHPYAADWMKRVEGWVDAADLLGVDAPPGYRDNGPRPVSPLGVRYHEALYDRDAMGRLLSEAAVYRGPASAVLTTAVEVDGALNPAREVAGYRDR